MYYNPKYDIYIYIYDVYVTSRHVGARMGPRGAATWPRANINPFFAYLKLFLTLKIAK